MMSEPQAPPSAQVVAHEFVKQYYTMLNAAPDFLHRFYSHNSSFIHGDDQYAVTGQAEIHKKITSLKFVNCHARICQVDSQSSVSGSVVIQVIGELSNAGQPMRRFVQSFVLAPQTANKYYVHVDIFRYQDNHISVNDGEEIQESSTDQYVENGEHEKEPTADGVHLNVVVEDGSQPEFEQNQEYTDGDVTEVTATNEPEPTTVEAEATVVSEQETVTDGEPTEETSEAQGIKEIANTVNIVEEVKPVEQPEKRDKEVPSSSAAETPVPSKPMTWAAMASRNAGAVTGANQPTSNTANCVIQAKPPAPTGVTESKLEPPRATRPAPAIDDRNAGSNGRVVMNGNKEGESAPKRPTGSGSGGLGVYPDNQQVFVGNLPQHLTDQELIEFFEQFGVVLDFRINRKPGGVGNNLGQKNFGFMVFEKSETVEKVLAARPLFLGKHRLNIEEKKAKEELARSRVTRFPASGPRNTDQSGNYSRPTANGAGARRGGRNEIRSNSSDDGPTN